MENFLVDLGRKEMEKSVHYNWKNKKEEICQTHWKSQSNFRKEFCIICEAYLFLVNSFQNGTIEAT